MAHIDIIYLKKIRAVPKWKKKPMILGRQPAMYLKTETRNNWTSKLQGFIGG
jgi:hypothetical protein